MLTKDQYELLLKVKSSPFLKPDNYESAEDFNRDCSRTKKLIQLGMIEKGGSRQFLPNGQGGELDYAIVGSLKLTSDGLDVCDSGTWEQYMRANRSKEHWSLDRRLVVIGLILAIITLATSLL